MARVDSGGVCHFGCDSGKCICSAGNRFLDTMYKIPISNPLFTGEFTDTKTGLKWLVLKPGGGLTLSSMQTYCTSSKGRLATADEVISILAQEEVAVHCASTHNLDSTINAYLKTGVGGPITEAAAYGEVWTSDVSGGLSVTVSLSTGGTGTKDPTTKLWYATQICVIN